MVSLDDAVIARYEKQGDRFEVLVDPEKAQEIREGAEIPLSDVLVIDAIFKDAKKGDHASEHLYNKIFDTEDVEAIALIIIKQGEIQLTTQQKKNMQDVKRKQIVEIIAKNAINPQTKTPHPPQRIELALEEARIHVDPFKPAQSQVQDILKKLQAIMPIRFEKVTLAIKIPGNDYARCYQELHDAGRMLKEEWQSDGSWIGLIEIPAGIQLDLIDRIQSKTKGQAEVKNLK
jgi:ribosome maturation protein SDO1